MTTNWKAYYKKIGDSTPRPLLLEAVLKCNHRTQALDIGAGSMSDSFYLLKEDFTSVTAVDSSESFGEITKTIKHPHLKIVNNKIEDFDFSQFKFDLINAQFSLPFIGKSFFGKIWSDIEFSLSEDGIFCGQLFGINDAWNTPDSLLIFHTKKEVESLVSSFETVLVEEVENDGITAAGAKKHWHIFNLILRKK